MLWATSRTLPRIAHRSLTILPLIWPSAPLKDSIFASAGNIDREFSLGRKQFTNFDFIQLHFLLDRLFPSEKLLSI